jgi:hypothetical protein
MATLDIDLSDIVVCRECGCVYSLHSANNPHQCVSSLQKHDPQATRGVSRVSILEMPIIMNP